ncbi:BglG family transcription antiterminator, partial [Geobacillus thermocatenulatus]|uniref:BglG family transcription antiterminator n=1 Tax=Geobacillus thermocatenulatus TaxID=33938 RepID=UPI0004733428
NILLIDQVFLAALNASLSRIQEIDYIIVHLLGTKLIHKETLNRFSEFDELGTIIQCMLKRLKTELNWDFYEDTEFIQALTLHIRPAMNRLRYNMNIRNPLLNEIKTRYPSAFEGAVIASKCIEHHLGMEVGEHEIAYIALHIGVALERLKTRQKKAKRVIIVCASGVGSAKLLLYRLQNAFKGEIEVVASTNYYQLRDYDLSSIDFVISTIPINDDIGVPVQVVTTFLDEEDINNIRKKLSPMKSGEKEKYLDESRVFVQKDFRDKESVINFMCNELYKQGLVSKGYVNLVLERESIAPTNFGNLVAIPHPLTPETEETFWTVCTLKRPIEWHGKHKVQLVCLLNIKKGSTGDLDRMYQKLIAILEDKSIVRKVIKSESAKEIVEILNT